MERDKKDKNAFKEENLTEDTKDTELDDEDLTEEEIPEENYELSEEVQKLIKEETTKNIFAFRELLREDFENILAKREKKFKDELERDKKQVQIEEMVGLFLEHYTSIKAYVENAKREDMSKENLNLAENEFLKEIMESRIDSSEKESQFSVVFKNIEKTEKLLNFLTSIFIKYIKENREIYKESNPEKSKNRNIKRNQRTTILLENYYMKGMSLSKIGLYTAEVYRTGSSQYQKQFLVDRRILIKNLSPLLFGIDGIEGINLLH